MNDPTEFYRKSAKRLLKDYRAGKPPARSRVASILKDTNNVTLMRVQHVIAVEQGHANWNTLLQETRRNTPNSPQI